MRLLFIFFVIHEVKKTKQKKVSHYVSFSSVWSRRDFVCGHVTDRLLLIGETGVEPRKWLRWIWSCDAQVSLTKQKQTNRKGNRP